jgi:hypothetical protein
MLVLEEMGARRAIDEGGFQRGLPVESRLEW